MWPLWNQSEILISLFRQQQRPWTSANRWVDQLEDSRNIENNYGSLTWVGPLRTHESHGHTDRRCIDRVCCLRVIWQRFSPRIGVVTDPGVGGSCCDWPTELFTEGRRILDRLVRVCLDFLSWICCFECWCVARRLGPHGLPPEAMILRTSWPNER